ncbi:MAG: flavocytochrome c [Blautia sp.]|nr:flavocytochrome c [Blautia sp.]
MKKQIRLALAMLAGVTMIASSAMAEEAVTATGVGTGIDGDVVVEVTATQDEILSVTVTEQNETVGIGSVAVETLPEEIVQNQTLDVDDISGATVTSTAIKDAVREALESSGIDPEAFTGAPEGDEEAAPAEDLTLDTDIVVIGAGGAGMAAAIVAKDAGKDVVILESQAMVGGNSVRSTGGMNAAKTALQDENAFDEGAGVEKQLGVAADTYADNEVITSLAATVAEQWAAYQENPEGYFDSVELFELDTMIGGKALNDPELVATLCENSADAIDWLASIEAPLTSVSSFGGASVKRIHRPVGEDGKTVSVGSYLIPIFQSNLEERGIDLHLNTTATKLLVEDGAVVGVEAEGPDGQKVTVNAKSVVLATGGFGANLEKVAELKPELEGFMTTNAPGILGQGIAMAEEVGAATVDMDQIQIHPTVQADTAALITEGLRGDGAILVNEEGLRFIDEVGTRDVVSAAEIAQTGSHSWLIVDQAMVDASSVIGGYITKGYTVSGETYEELAEAMGVDAAAFAETMEKWNGYVENKEDPDFGRTSFASPLNVAPYYGINVTAGIHHTMGGLKINPAAQVLNTDGEVIPNLFAAGEVTGGVHGGNRLGGNAVADFVVFGRIAGDSAVANAQ